MIWKMVGLSQCCSVMGIQEWGKHILGGKASRLEKGNVDADHYQITAPW